MVIAADDVLGAGGEPASDDRVVVGVARHRAGRRGRIFDDAGEIEQIGAERLRHLRRVAVVGLGSALAHEGRQGLGDNVGRKVGFDIALGDEPQQRVRNSSRLIAARAGEKGRLEFQRSIGTPAAPLESWRLRKSGDAY